ncbi:MAG TPA: sugar ABC transporter substrate-binding protein [Anaeromyxobacter sp.]|nr:sugar ABC transporter substrate-binding protein [Anaeromyxobacter sp.]
MPKLRILCSVVSAVLMLTAGQALAAPKPKVIRVGVSYNEKIHSQIQAWTDEMEKFGKAYGQQHNVSFKWIVNVANGDPSTQASNIQDLINQHVDVIVARAEDAAAIGASIDAAHKAHIPFITFDRQSSTVQPDVHVGGDSFAQGITAANAAVELLKKNGVQGKAIELLGDLKDMNAVLRSQAWHQVEAASKAWTTVAQVPTDWKPENFYTGTANALAAHPEANVIFAASDFAFDGVLKALKEANRLAPAGDPRHVWMFTCDVQPQALEPLTKGYIDVAASYEAYAQADALVTVIAELLAGQKVQGTHLVPGRLFTPQNTAAMPAVWSRDYKD